MFLQKGKKKVTGMLHAPNKRDFKNKNKKTTAKTRIQRLRASTR